MIHYLVCCKFSSSSAVCNRIRLFDKGLNEIGYKCKVHYLDFGGGRIYKLIAFIKHTIGLFILASKLTKEDVLIIYGETPLTHLYSYIRRRTNFLIEKTEYPLHLIIQDLPFFTYKRSVRNLQNYHKAAGLITCSSALKNFFSEYNNEIFISPLIVDIKEFTEVSATNKPIEDRYIAYCGSLNNNKDGVPTLIRSFERFHSKYNKVKLVIIGPGSPNTIEEINHLISDCGLLGYVILTGPLPHEKLANWLNNAVMLALARPNNKQAEGGMPSKVGEYLATGVPCVVTNVGDLHLYVQDGRDCYMAEPDSVDSFCSKMIQCYEADNTEIIENAKRTAQTFNYKEQASLLGDYIKHRFPEFVVK